MSSGCVSKQIILATCVMMTFCRGSGKAPAAACLHECLFAGHQRLHVQYIVPKSGVSMSAQPLLASRSSVLEAQYRPSSNLFPRATFRLQESGLDGAVDHSMGPFGAAACQLPLVPASAAASAGGMQWNQQPPFKGSVMFRPATQLAAEPSVSLQQVGGSRSCPAVVTAQQCLDALHTLITTMQVAGCSGGCLGAVQCWQLSAKAASARCNHLWAPVQIRDAVRRAQHRRSSSVSMTADWEV